MSDVVPNLLCARIVSLFFVVQQVHTQPVVTTASSTTDKPNRAPRTAISLLLLGVTGVQLVAGISSVSVAFAQYSLKVRNCSRTSESSQHNPRQIFVSFKSMSYPALDIIHWLSEYTGYVLVVHYLYLLDSNLPLSPQSETRQSWLQVLLSFLLVSSALS